MEGDEIGLVLARASELRTKIAGCIARVGKPDRSSRCGRQEEDDDDDEEADVKEEEQEEEEEEESLVGISDALESLERQLTSLQDLQQQHRYERETILNQIDRRRRLLLNNLREYKGQEWEVIHEASAFAGETIEHDDGLILPPYSSHVSNSFVLDDLYPPNYASRPKLLHNGLDSEGINEDNTTANGPENCNTCPSQSSSSGGIRSFIGWMTKSAITVVSVISILRVAGYKTVLRKDRIKLETLRFSKPAGGERQRATLQCPPGKVLVIEDGKAHCLVKERIEIPFETDVTSPNARYGFG